MAIFDPVERKIVVRVAYDGVAFAGKTTNLAQLCQLFGARRGAKLEQFGELSGRTLFFDWVKVVTGAVGGFPLECQVVTVPGQIALTPRRRALLEDVDVVILVCDSSPGALDRARAALGLLHELRRGGALVLQANHQDAPGAVPGHELARGLGLGDAPTIEAIASEGMGVVDTFVAAVRLVVRELQQRLESGDLRLETRRPDTPSELLSRVASRDLDRDAAAEMLLEQALASIVASDAERALVRDPALRRATRDAAAEIDRLVARDGPGAPATGSKRPAPPRADVPTGFIWPAHTGRAILSSLEFAAAAKLDGARAVLESRGFVASTRAASQFEDHESARQALVRFARVFTQLEGQRPGDTVLVAQPGEGTTCWLWVVRPALPPLSSERTIGGETARALGRAVAHLARTAARHRFTIDLSLDAFGLEGSRLRYVGDVGLESPDASKLGVAVAEIIAAIERGGGDVGAFVEAVERELGAPSPGRRPEGDAPPGRAERVCAMICEVGSTA